MRAFVFQMKGASFLSWGWGSPHEGGIGFGGGGLKEIVRWGRRSPMPPPTMGNSEHHLVMQTLQLKSLRGKGVGPL